MTTVEPKPTLDDFRMRCAHTYWYLNQDEVWRPNGRPAVAITAMEREWRYNASRWLERHAPAFELQYTFGQINALGARTLCSAGPDPDGVEYGPAVSHLDLMGEHAADAFDAEIERRATDPIGWIRTTDLHRALVAELPTKRKRLAELAARARHYAGCAGRVGQEPCSCALLAPDLAEH